MEISSQSAAAGPHDRVQLQLESCLRQAHALAGEIGTRLGRGDDAHDQLNQLEDLVRNILATPTHAPAGVAESVQRLLHTLQSARSAASTWLEQVATPELEQLARSQQGMQVYRQRGAAVEPPAVQDDHGSPGHPATTDSD